MSSKVPNHYLPEPFKGLTDEVLLRQYPHEFRFRDPEFVEKRTRMEMALAAWKKVWWSCPLGTPPYFSDKECPDHPVAREMVEARRAWLEDERRRLRLEEEFEGGRESLLQLLNNRREHLL